MTDSEIEYGNVLIAEFMGEEIKRIDAPHGESFLAHKVIEQKEGTTLQWEWDWMNLTPEQLSQVTEEKWYYVGDGFNGLKYHGDWNWLMNAVDKIESRGQILLFDELGKDRRRVVKFHSRPYYGFGDEISTDTKIQAVFQAVVEIIERINENKLEENK
jgi:hypothetical protein